MAITSSAEDFILEEREEFMVSLSHTGGLASKRIARFLKPTIASLEDSSFKLPLLSPKSKWPLDVVFSGWQDPLKTWEIWVDQMYPKYHSVWREAGILEAILSTRYKFNIDDELVFGVAERWCADTNTFVFPWGEASITLEDVMILGGFSTLGSSALLPLEGENLVGIETILKMELKKFETMRRYTHNHWIRSIMRHGDKYEHEAFLAFWLLRCVFPVNEITKIREHILPIAIHLASGIKLALAPTVLASIYRDLSTLKEIMTASTELEAKEGKGIILASTLWAPMHLVQLWVWERFVQFRPQPNSLRSGEPRAARWHDLQRLEAGNVRSIIDSSSDVFLWRPYCLIVDNWSLPKFYKEREEWICIGQYLDEELQSFARCLRVCALVGIDCEEVYQPHRVAMQFGYDQDLPGLVPRLNSSTEGLCIDYNRPLSNDARLYFPSRLFEPDVSLRYSDWWRNSVLVPVDPVHVLRRRRSLRRVRRYFPNQEQTRTPGVEMDAPAEQNIQVRFVNQNVSNMKQVKVEEEDNYPEVPPGFSPKLQKATPTMCNARPKTVTTGTLHKSFPPSSLPPPSSHPSPLSPPKFDNVEDKPPQSGDGNNLLGFSREIIIAELRERNRMLETEFGKSSHPSSSSPPKFDKVEDKPPQSGMETTFLDSAKK